MADAEDQKQQEQPEEPSDKPEAAEQGKPEASADVKDRFGQEGVNKERHDKEVADLNKKITDMTAKLDESAKTEKARDDLKAEIRKVRDEIDEERTSWKLEKAGCRNIKAAKALLEDHDGDVEKLKEAEPWLFEEEKPKGATGLKPGGAPDDKAKRRAVAYEAAGVPLGK